ncbi:MAG: DUF4294 domain-containing protein [Bacteroidales bacterium]|nr:DUF4294 domain-containing protein [Bacteroidales bacterium]MBQ6578908.1 DUF4294 domain-containing protein [Bacteroidales bacterium]
MTKKSAYFIVLLATSLLSLLLTGGECRAQLRGNFMEYQVVGQDTVYFDFLTPSRVWVRQPKQKGREWRKYYRLVHNFSKVYPYAIEAKDLMMEVDKTFDEKDLSRRKKDKYINSIQKDLLDRYEPVLKQMTVSQGKVLIKLISRETGLTPYDIIKNYKSSVAAGFWQGIAKMFTGDLKVAFDPQKDEDRAIEELVQIWETDDFAGFYWSIFGEYPKVPVLPTSKKKGKG